MVSEQNGKLNFKKYYNTNKKKRLLMSLFLCLMIYLYI